MEERERSRVVDTLMELLRLPPEDRDRLMTLVQSYPPQKLVAAARAVAQFSTKNMRLRRRITVEEFEKIVKRMRW